MIELGGGVGFDIKNVERLLAMRDTTADHLDGSHSAQPFVASLEDDPHATARDFASSSYSPKATWDLGVHDLFLELFPDEVLGTRAFERRIVAAGLGETCRTLVAASLASSLQDVQSWLGVECCLHTQCRSTWGYATECPIIHWKARPRYTCLCNQTGKAS